MDHTPRGLKSASRDHVTHFARHVFREEAVFTHRTRSRGYGLALRTLVFQAQFSTKLCKFAFFRENQPLLMSTWRLSGLFSWILVCHDHAVGQVVFVCAFSVAILLASRSIR